MHRKPLWSYGGGVRELGARCCLDHSRDAEDVESGGERVVEGEWWREEGRQS